MKPRLDEKKIIQMLAQTSAGWIGDDAALLPPNTSAERYVVTNDVLVEDVHFRTKYVGPEDLAHKSLHVNLSDLAAMGAMPKYILCGISIPRNLAHYAELFLQKLPLFCQTANVILIGGDTTQSPDKLYISITAIGVCQQGAVLYRNTAKINDVICISGNVGWAHLGWRALEQTVQIPLSFQQAFLRPEAKIAEGQWLAQQANVTSMMDISDGLYIDLLRLCEASRVGAVLQLATFAPTADFITTCQLLHLDVTKTLLTGGEDYSLLFTVKADFYADLAQDFFNTFHNHIQPIGHIIQGAGIQLKQHNQTIQLPLTPFTHFGENI